MRITLCSVCGKPIRNGGLCEKHAKAYYDFYEEMKYREEEKDED